MIRIGFHTVPAKDAHEATMLSVGRGGRLLFEGTAHIGRGSKIFVSSGAELVLGDNFAISASSQIVCHERIQFGKDVQLSWDCLFMDSDSHVILDEQMQPHNPTKAIEVGDKVWVGCRSTILKGSVIPSDCVVGACSLVAGGDFASHSVIAGIPAKSIKKIGGWKL